MKTIAFYDMFKSVFEDRIKKIEADTKEAYEASLENVKKEVSEIAKEFRHVDPIMAPYLLPALGEASEIEYSEIPILIERAKVCAKNRHGLGLIYTGACSGTVVQRTVINYPKYIDFTGKSHILIKPYNEQAWEDFAVRMMNQILLGALMYLPKGTVHVNFVNPSMSNKSSFLSSRLSSDLCGVFVEKKEIQGLMSSLLERIKSVLKSGKLLDSILPKYEFVVLLDYPYMFDGITEDMRILIEQGQQAGIHFIVLNDQRRMFEEKEPFDLLSFKDTYFQEPSAFDNAKAEDYDNTICYTYQLCDQPALLKACVDYLNSDVEDSANENITTEDYAIVEKGIIVPVGTPVNKKTMDFCLGQDGHVHGFIIGRSGTGKSVLLHDIIIGAIQKYSPEDLQLYLLDCKLGGVEFNQYKEVKHVRALLVDNSDILIILEILRDLGTQMRERGRILRECGYQKIDEYNEAHTDKKMSRIWVVIDECHVLFEQNSTTDRKLRNEIIEIITKVATEGRNQGVHLIMATQTLANADIPTAILNNITDRYVLNCAPIDAEKMWSGCSKQNANLCVGDVLYHNTSGSSPDVQFHATYISKEHSEKQISAAVSKASGHESNGQFYFNGSQVLRFDNSVVDAVLNAKKESLKACLGKSIDLKQPPVTITLKQDMSENVLITGIDEYGQATRTTIDVLCSLVLSNRKRELNYRFYVFDCKNEEDDPYQDVLDVLSSSDMVSVVRKRDYGTTLQKLVDGIKNGTPEPSILVIIGQQRFRELKLDVELSPSQNDSGGYFGANSFKGLSSQVKTYKDAMKYILEEGPDNHVHVILQVDKLPNLLFEDYVTGKFVYRLFRHIVLLKSDLKSVSSLGLADDIRPESLNSEVDRLRAIYFADGDDGWTLFSPFAIPDEKELKSLIS